MVADNDARLQWTSGRNLPPVSESVPNCAKTYHRPVSRHSAELNRGKQLIGAVGEIDPTF